MDPHAKRMKLELYGSTRSTCSLRVRLALAMKGLDWIDHRVRLDLDEQLTPAFLAINPDGLVPVLLADGVVVRESNVINEFLDEAFPEVPLRPNSPLERARMRSWMHHFDEFTVPAVRHLSFQRYYLDVVLRFPPAERAVFAQRHPSRAKFLQEIQETGFSAERLEQESALIWNTLNRMNDHLSHANWLVGEAPSLADLAVLPCVVRLDDMGTLPELDTRCGLAQWYERCRRLPAFDVAYYPGARFTPEEPRARN